MHDIWNSWHGCRKYSEGCDHCYMYYLGTQVGILDHSMAEKKAPFFFYLFQSEKLSISA